MSSASNIGADQANGSKDLYQKKNPIVMDDLESRVVEQVAHVDRPRSQLQKFRAALREPMAEFIGTAILIIFGAGSACTVVLSADENIASSQKGSFLSINIGWAIGIAMGVWVSGGISGGHINPAMTVVMAVWRGFPWRKVPAYIIAQVLGALVGAALVYGTYWSAIDIFEGGLRTTATSGIFVSSALPYMTAVSCFFAEFMSTAIFSMMILAMTDKRNMLPMGGMLPLALFVCFLGVGTSLGMQTSWPLNPARDFGPRIFLAMAGYGKDLWNYRNQYWLWCPILAPMTGAQVGALLYDLFLYDGPSILDRH